MFALAENPAGGEEGQRPCARGEWCGSRVVTFADGRQVITPGWTWRPYCDSCQSWIAKCAGELPGFYVRLAAMIGDPLQATVQVHVPFGPQLPLREDVDAQMRTMARIMVGWELRIRKVARMSRPDPVARIDTAQVVKRAAKVMEDRIDVLQALRPEWMTRTFSLPLSDEVLDWIGDSEAYGTGSGYVSAQVLVGGEDAGREILHLHYRCRSLLLETSPPAEVLIPPCRRCYHRALRRAWPAGQVREVFSRCDRCGDEMSSAEYDVNARRRLAAAQAGRELPVLGEAPAA